MDIGDILEREILCIQVLMMFLHKVISLYGTIRVIIPIHFCKQLYLSQVWKILRKCLQSGEYNADLFCRIWLVLSKKTSYNENCFLIYRYFLFPIIKTVCVVV